jgi:NACalpha-BTF3-like transcription factor
MNLDTPQYIEKPEVTKFTFEDVKKMYNPEFKLTYFEARKLKNQITMCLVSNDGKVEITEEGLEKQEDIKLILIQKYYGLNSVEDIIHLSFKEITDLYQPIETLDPLGLKVRTS